MCTKSVVFVGGLNYSGTTLLDLMLGSGSTGFSTGELYKLFVIPSQIINSPCLCGDEQCNIWYDLYKKGKKNIYHNIFELFPDVKYIVDSSKNPFWIKSNTKTLLKDNINVKNILIFKEINESGWSYYKRNKFYLWKQDWLKYHQLYINLFYGFSSLKYYDLTNRPSILEQLCKVIEIPFEKNMLQYWTKSKHTIGGNSSAKRFLLSNDSRAKYFYTEKFLEQRKNYIGEFPPEVKQIYYEQTPFDIDKLSKHVFDEDYTMQQVYRLISNRNFLNDSNNYYAIQPSLKIPLYKLILNNYKFVLVNYIKSLKHSLLS